MPASVDNIFPWACYLCGKRYIHGRHLASHLDRIHNINYFMWPTQQRSR